MLELIRYAKGDLIFFIGLVRLLPWLAGMKAGLIKNETAKEKMLSLYFKGIGLKDFNELCAGFTTNKLPSIIRKDAMDAIEFHKINGHEIAVVSASAENWIKPWCDLQGIQTIATHLQTDNENILTGNLLTMNCNGDEKVNRIRAVYDLHSFEDIYCYGDSNGDKQMLQLATHAFYRHFKH